MLIPYICPHCEANLIGPPIRDVHLAQGLYPPGITHYSRAIGVVEPGVYDGVLCWQCPECGKCWHRWPEGDDRRNRAQGYMRCEL